MPAPSVLRYSLSLPERLIRSTIAICAGFFRKVGELILPGSFRRTALYRAMVGVSLRFLIEEVGQVEGVYAPSEHAAPNFVLQRTASHGIELLGLLTLHASPVWILAALADATGAGHTLVLEISQALKEEGLLDPNSQFETMDQLLDGLEQTSSHLALTLNMPPVDLAGLRREWFALREKLPNVPAVSIPAAERLEHIWRDMSRLAKVQDRSVFAISSLMAISAVGHVPGNLLWLSRATRSAVRRTGKVVGGAVLDHYVEAMAEIGKAGFVPYWKRAFQPYLHAAGRQFSPAHESLTERLLKRR